MFQPVRSEALPPKERDRIERHYAIRATAIRDDVAAFTQLAHTSGEVCQGHGERAWKMTRNVLLARPDVDHRNLSRANTACELLIVHRFQRAARSEVLTRDVLDFCQTGFRQAPQTQKELAHGGIGESIRDVQARFLTVHQTRSPEHLQMVRGGGHALTGLPGERFDGSRALGKQVEQLETPCARRGLTDACDLVVNGRLQRGRATFGRHNQVFKCSFEYFHIIHRRVKPVTHLNRVPGEGKMMKSSQARDLAFRNEDGRRPDRDAGATSCCNSSSDARNRFNT